MEVNFLALRIQQILDQVIRCSCQMYHLLDVLTMVNKQMMDKRNDLPNIRIPYRTHTMRERVCLGKESNAPINLMFHAPNPSSVPGGRNGPGNLNLAWLVWEILIWKYRFFSGEYMSCFNVEVLKANSSLYKRCL